MTESPSHGELPLPDYDHIPLGTLPSRIHGLDQGQIEALLAYEEAHGQRLPVKEVLEQRRRQLEAGAEPSGQVPESLPEKTQNAGESPVSPATAGPKMNPPFEGRPVNPHHPR